MAEFNEDLRVRGNITGDSYTVPDGAFGNAQFNSGDPIDIHKQRNQILKEGSNDRSTVVAALRQVIHRAKEKGTLLDFEIGNSVAATVDASATYDLYKNGASVLGAAKTLNSTNNNPLVTYPATIANATYNAGDIFEIVITVSPGAGVLAKGYFWWARFDEDPSV